MKMYQFLNSLSFPLILCNGKQTPKPNEGDKSKI